MAVNPAIVTVGCSPSARKLFRLSIFRERWNANDNARLMARGPRKGSPVMCDYSLQNVATRSAVVADQLITANFPNTVTRGFAAVGEPSMAVCLRPGTEIAFAREPRYTRWIGFGWRTAPSKVARFRQVDIELPTVHHDALEFCDGTVVLVANLLSGQRATVLQLPVTPVSVPTPAAEPTSVAASRQGAASTF
jgi:hypothetical protein